MIYNPLEQFEIFQFIAIEGPLFGYIQIGLTNIGFYLLLSSLFLIFLHLQYNREGVLGLGNTLMLCMESLFGFVLQLVKNQVGPKGQPYFPALYSLFLFILLLNLVGLIPYSFCATAQFALTLGLSSTIVLGVTILGLKLHGFHFFSLFVPAGTPLALVPLLTFIETVSYVARTVSLGVRLGVNMLAGHVLLHIIASFSWKIITGSILGLLITPVPVLFLTLLFGLELGVALIQAYVFVLLTCSYINDALFLHSEEPSSALSSNKNLPLKPFGLSKREYSTLSSSSKNSTSVVLWGSNLYSTLGLRFSDKLRNIFALPPYVYSIIVGLILSDGHLQKGKLSKNARLSLNQSIKHVEFAQWMYSILSHYCQSLPYLFTTTIDGKVFTILSIRTRCYPCLTLLHSAWYSDKVKIVPPTIFEDLTPIALAVWAQGDGCKHNNGFNFNTQSFTLKETVLLLNILNIKYGLNCTIYFDRKKPVLHIKSNSMSAFRTLVTPYFHPSMLYKLR
jgi:F-type H+-transporting ATPase subunit a